MQIGDKVKYLNDVGGGTVVRFQSRNVVLILQDDGFEVPVLKTECIVIESAQPKKENRTNGTKDESTYTPKPIDPKNTEETLCFALVSQDKKNITPSVDAYIVNLSNYYRLFTITESRGDKIITIDSGEIEPNTKVRVDSIATSEMGSKMELKIQILSYKKESTFEPQAVIDKTLQIKPQKLANIAAYKKTIYFHEPAIVYALLEDNLQSDLDKLIAKHTDKDSTPAKKVKKNSSSDNEVIKNGIVEVDLHIHELLDDTTGMSNSDMLKYQMDVFHKKIGKYRNKKGQKIAFIHGKGNGVLKNEILRSLKREVKVDYYDASFQQYGFGATMVVLR